MNRLPNPAVAVLAAALSASAVSPQDLWDQNTVRDFRFTFASTDFWRQLQSSQSTGQEVRANLIVDNRLYQDVGIRMRSSSSALVRGVKMPFNLKMDRFVPGQDLYGFQTLNLNNGAVDPTMTRETISYHILRHYIPAPRTAYFRLFFNDTYWGLYILVEQPNKRFLRDWFSSDEGSRYKGDAPGAAAVETSTLNWLGTSVSRYQQAYELKTPAHPNAWTDLIHGIDKLNHEPDATFVTEIQRIVNVDRALWYMAVMNLIVNSDDYMGAGHNYYMYFDPDDGRMNMLPWDLNEAFGVHGPSVNPWTYPVLQNATSFNRPLTRRLLAVPQWRELYYAHYRTAMNRWMRWVNVLSPLNLQFQDLIRADVHNDPNFLYPGHFRPSFNGRFWADFHWVHGLRQVVENREAFLRQIPDLTKPEPQIDSVTPLQATVATGQPFWVTARVTGNPAISTVVLRYAVVGRYDEVTMHDDGAHRDGAAGDRVWGASFPAGPPLRTMRYYVHATDVTGTVQVSPLEAEHVFLSFRVDAGDPVGPTRINELVAANDNGDQDEAGDFEDWVELHNTGSQAYDVGDHYLSDVPDQPTKWRIPANTVIPAGGFVRIWCDDEPGDGPLHATFKLDKDGEWLVLFDTDANGNRLLDGVSFGAQPSDRAFGRVPDGGRDFFHVWNPTGAAPLCPPGTHTRYDGRPAGSPANFELDGRGVARAGANFTFELRGGQPSSAVALAFAAGPAHFDVPPFGVLAVDPLAAIVVPVTLDSSGARDITLAVPPGVGGFQLFGQALNLDLSNALVVRFAP